MAALCHDLHPRWAARLREETGIDNGFLRCGGIYLARDAAAEQHLRQQANDWTERGIKLTELSPADLEKVEPALAKPALVKTAVANTEHDHPIRYAVLLPEEAQLRNPRHLKALIAACALHGVRLTSGVAVDDFEVVGHAIRGVRAGDTTYAAQTVCVTSGSWTRSLLARLGVHLPIKPIRGQIALLNSGVAQLRRIVNEGPRYLVPRPDGRTLVGSTEEDVGFEKRTTAGAIAGLLAFAVGLAPSLAAAQLERCWAGLRPGTPDGRPYLGKIPGLDNAFVAAGHFRSGLLLSPGTAVLLRQLILGQPSEIDLEMFRVDRGL